MMKLLMLLGTLVGLASLSSCGSSPDVVPDPPGVIEIEKAK